MRKSSKVSLLLVSGLMGVGSIGCGGDSSTTTSTGPAAADAGDEASTQAESPPEVSKSDYIAEADEVCQAVRPGNIKIAEERTDLSEEVAGTPSAELAREIEDLILEQAKAREMLTKDLEALEEPATGGPDEYLDSRRESVKKYEATAKAWGVYADQLDEESVAGLNEATEAESKSVEENAKLAEQYGFEVCGALFKK